MYRNYDGARSMFGDVSVRAASADQSQVSIYAAQRSSDGALTLMIVNKTATPLTSTLTLSNFAAAPAAQVYSYSANNLAAIVRQADQAVSADGFTATFPASSITLIVIPLQTLAFTWHVYLPLIRR
jgi:O-glycosyl hydrolase